MTLEQRAKKLAREQTKAAIAKAADQLAMTWGRRDISDEDALEVRHEYLALQRVEQNLTRIQTEDDNA
jgi:hypothetical protein